MSSIVDLLCLETTLDGPSLIWNDTKLKVDMGRLEQRVLDLGGDATISELLKTSVIERKKAERRIRKANQVEGKSGLDHKVECYALNKSLVQDVIDFFDNKAIFKTIDNNVSLFIKKENNSPLYVFGHQPNLYRKEVVDKFLRDFLSHDKGYGVIAERWVAKLKEKIEDAKEIYFLAGKSAPPSIQDLVAEALNELLRGVARGSDLDSYDVFAWDKPAVCTLNSQDLVNARVKGKTPYFDEFLSRVDFPDELMAFVWKVFDANDCKGRQMYWGRSQGNAGQSTFWNVIQSFLDPVTRVLNKVSYSDKFTNAQYYLKRLAICPDCRDPLYHEHQLIKNLTGGDVVTINHLYSEPFTAKIWSRVVVHSNAFPLVDTSDNSLVTRLLLFQVKAIDTKDSDLEREEKLKGEFWDFLKKCQKVEARVCGRKLVQTPEGVSYDTVPRNIPVPDAMKEQMLIRCETPERRAVKLFLDQNIVKDWRGKVSSLTIREGLKEFLNQSLHLQDKRQVKRTLTSGKEGLMDVVTRRLTTHIEKWQADTELLPGDPNTVFKGVSWRKGSPFIDEENLAGDTVIEAVEIPEEEFIF